MANLTLAQLLDPGTADGATQDLLTLLGAQGLPALAWQDGSVPKTLAKGQGAANYNQKLLSAALARGGYVTTQPGVTGASGDWLDLVGEARYGLKRNPAVAAVHSVLLTDAGNAGPFNITAGQLWVANTASLGGATPLRFTNQAGGVLSKGGTLALPCQAEQAGAAYDVGIGTITTLITSLPGVTVTNPDLGGGSSLTTQGVDKESDLAYSLRCLGRWASLGTGSPAAAYDLWARTASAEVTRTKVQASGTVAGQVDVYLAGVNGAASGAALTAVANYLAPRVPLGSAANVVAATNFITNLIGTVHVQTAYLAAATAAVGAALIAFWQTIPIGGTVYVSAVIEVIMGPAGVRDFTLTSIAGGSGDVVLTATQVSTLMNSLVFTAV